VGSVLLIFLFFCDVFLFLFIFVLFSLEPNIALTQWPIGQSIILIHLSVFYDFLDCHNNICNGHGTCHNNYFGHTCKCDNGYIGHNCGRGKPYIITNNIRLLSFFQHSLYIFVIWGVFVDFCSICTKIHNRFKFVHSTIWIKSISLKTCFF
jgi:hypothetical protein